MISRNIIITGLTRNGACRIEGRRHVLAWFNAELCGLIELRGCMLVRTVSDGLAVVPPRLDKDDPRRGVRIVDKQLLNAMQVAARETYVRLGGEGLPAWANREAA
jgi:hypothetical protein